MIPRITIRDAKDAELLKLGIVELARKVQQDFRNQAVHADVAEQLALTMEMNERVEHLMGLLRAVGDGTMSEALTTEKEEVK